MLEVVCPPEGIQEEPQLPLSGLTYGFLIINCSGIILTIICLIIIQVRDVILFWTAFVFGDDYDDEGMMSTDDKK